MKRSITLVLLTLTAVLLAACSAGQAGSGDLTLTATDVAFDVDMLEVSEGRTVKITLDNQGTVTHDFSIMSMPHMGDVMTSETEMESGEHAMDMGNMDMQPEVHVAAEAGSSSTVEFTPSQPGEYEFFCSVPGHKEAGMHGTLVVKER